MRDKLFYNYATEWIVVEAILVRLYFLVSSIAILGKHSLFPPPGVFTMVIGQQAKNILKPVV